MKPGAKLRCAAGWVSTAGERVGGIKCSRTTNGTGYSWKPLDVFWLSVSLPGFPAKPRKTTNAQKLHRPDVTRPDVYRVEHLKKTTK